jgi:hypothetical protein
MGNIRKYKPKEEDVVKLRKYIKKIEDARFKNK